LQALPKSGSLIQRSRYVKNIHPDGLCCLLQGGIRETITDLKKLDKYLLELYTPGSRNYIYIDYRTSSYDKYKAQAREEALADAKKKARQISTGLHHHHGKSACKLQHSIRYAL
jgi:hypothetical protein